MPGLKKGSKGKDVEQLQKLLNKGGWKTPVDGIYDPKTESAVKEFQKKVKLKVDGMATEEVMAALKYGKPLPVMTVQDYAARKKQLDKDYKDNGDIIAIYKKMGKSAEDGGAKAAREVDAAVEHINANFDTWGEIIKMCDQIAKKQAEFDKLRLKDPGAAEKLLKECEKLHDKIEATGKDKLGPNRKKAVDALNRASDALDDVLAAIKEGRKAIEAEKATW